MLKRTTLSVLALILLEGTAIAQEPSHEMSSGWEQRHRRGTAVARLP